MYESVMADGELLFGSAKKKQKKKTKNNIFKHKIVRCHVSPDSVFRPKKTIRRISTEIRPPIHGCKTFIEVPVLVLINDSD